MKRYIRKSNRRRLKKVGYRTRSKTHGGRQIIKRRIRSKGKFVVG